MRSTGRALVRTDFGLVAAFTVLGSLFVAGYAFEDVGGWAAVGLVALWLVPMALLSVVAYLWPSVGSWILAGAVTLVAANAFWFAIDNLGWRAALPDGPVLGVSVFALLLPLAFLGLRRAITAGALLLTVAVVTYTAFLVSVAGDAWHGLAGSLSTSSTVVVVPAVVFGLLFLGAGLLERHDPQPTDRPLAPRHTHPHPA